MARAKSNGAGHLDESIVALKQSTAALNQSMVAFQARCAETDARWAELRRISDARWAETTECFARIEAILMEHSRILRALPDAICEKLGFKPPEPPPAASPQQPKIG
jgi:hypothetical protein